MEVNKEDIFDTRQMLGVGKTQFQRIGKGLLVTLPKGKKPNDISLVLKIN